MMFREKPDQCPEEEIQDIGQCECHEPEMIKTLHISGRVGGLVELKWNEGEYGVY
jgi:hypothetical protein